MNRPVLICVSYAACWLAVGMELLGIWRGRLRNWLFTSSLAAVPLTYLLMARDFGMPLPDSGGWTAIGTWILAIAAIVGIVYGARTLGHLARQTQELTKQTSASVAAAFPYLQLYGPSSRHTGHFPGGIRSWTGMVDVAGGTAPARDVGVWVRDVDGHYFAPIGVLLPSAKRRFDVPQASAGLIQQCPFAVMDDTPADQFRVWVGIIWRQPDRSWDYNLVVAQRNQGWELQLTMADRKDPGFRLKES